MVNVATSWRSVPETSAGLSLRYCCTLFDSITGMEDDAVAGRETRQDCRQLRVAMADVDEGRARVRL